MSTTLIPAPTALAVESADLDAVVLDFYRDIHKGIRNALFSVTFDAGRADPADRVALGSISTRVHALTALLGSHAHHEDVFIQPLVIDHARPLASRIDEEHEVLDAQIAALDVLAERAMDAAGSRRRDLVHRLYLGMASFTGAYLQHQDYEEIVVMPALSREIGVEELEAVEQQLIASIPPDEMMSSLALMLPAMNVEDRTELLGGLQAGAPAPVFDGVRGLAQDVLAPADYRALATRLGV